MTATPTPAELADDSEVVYSLARYAQELGAAQRRIAELEAELLASERRAYEKAAEVADEYAKRHNKSHAQLSAMPKTQQVRYEGHHYAGLNIAQAIRALATSPAPDSGGG